MSYIKDIIVERSELAIALDVADKYINELENKGIVKKIKHNQYKLLDNFQAYIIYLRELNKKELERVRSEKPSDDLARKSARLKELEILEREGKLIDAELNKIAWLEEYKMLSEKLDMFSIAAAGKIIEKFKELAKHEKTIKSIIEEEKDKIKNEIAEYPLEKEVKTND